MLALVAPADPPTTPATQTAEAATGEAASRLVEMFLSGRKATTLRAYQGDLRAFAQHLCAPSIDDAARNLLAVGHGAANGLVLTYRSAMLEHGYAPATINRRLAAVRSLVRLARLLGIVPWSVEVEGVASEAYRDTAGPGTDAVQRLLDELGKRDDAKGVRDTAIIRLAFDLGLRRGEIVGLDLEDLDAKARKLSVVAKGKFEGKLLTLPAPTLEVLLTWIAARGTAPGPLFTSLDHRPSSRGMRIAGNSVRRIVRALGSRTGSSVRPHGIRHSSITEALDQTRDPRAVRLFSRHAKIETVLKYDDNRTDLAGEVAAQVASRLTHKIGEERRTAHSDARPEPPSSSAPSNPSSGPTG